MCTGTFSDTLYISLRTRSDKPDAGKIIRKVVGRRGTSGGHTTYAGGQVHIPSKRKKDLQKIQNQLIQKFLTAVGDDKHQPEQLVK